MKKTFTTLAVLAMCTAAPAFAGHVHHHHYAGDGHDHTAATTTTTTRTSEVNTYRVVTPLSAEDVAVRRQMQTKIEKQVKRVDLNGDRLISYDEYANGDRILHEDNMDVRTSFRSIDKNGDGKLNSQEIMDARWAAMQRTAAPVAYTSTTQTVTYHD